MGEKAGCILAAIVGICGFLYSFIAIYREGLPVEEEFNERIVWWSIIGVTAVAMFVIWHVTKKIIDKK